MLEIDAATALGFITAPDISVSNTCFCKNIGGGNDDGDDGNDDDDAMKKYKHGLSLTTPGCEVSCAN